MKTASAASVAPLGQTGAPTTASPPLPLGPLSGARYPDARLESMKKPKVSFGPTGFPAFAGTMAVERVATGFRWAEGPVYFPAGRYVLFSDIPNNRIMRFSEDDGHVSVYRQPSMNSNGNTIDREGRLITCEHSGRRVTRTELDGSITIIADKYNGKKLNSPNDAVVAADGTIWFCDPAYGIGGFYEGIKAEPSRTRRTSTGWIRNPVTSRWSSMTSWSRTAFASRLTRRSSISAIPASRTGRTTRRIFACSTWISRPESFRTARSLPDMPKPSITDGLRCDTEGRLWCSVGWGDPNEDGVRCYTPDGDLLGKIHIPETVANLCFGGQQRNRLYICGSSVALCGLHQCAGGDECRKRLSPVIASAAKQSISPRVRMHGIASSLCSSQ
jgi:gluconolactonase